MIKIYRKDAFKVAKPTKDEMAYLERSIELRCRVQRPDVVTFFASGAYNKLPELSPALVRDTATRILDHEQDGWIVPESCYGRAVVGVDEQSTANSIRLWIAKHLDTLIPADCYAVVVE